MLDGVDGYPKVGLGVECVGIKQKEVVADIAQILEDDMAHEGLKSPRFGEATHRL